MRVLIACGGTAGHIFPGLALAEELKGGGNQSQIIMVVSTHRRDRKYLKAASLLLNGVPIERVGSVALPYKLSFKYVTFALRLFWAFLKSFIIILRYSPQVVVGFGGYASFAPLVVARMMGIPTLIHEQNIKPGRANRFLARIVDKVVVSFDETNNSFPKMKSANKVINAGLPLRKHILSCSSDKFKRVGDKFTILILGGSQGAHKINELVLDCLKLMDKAQLARIQLIHLAGQNDFHYVKSGYEALGITSEVFDFLTDIASAYKVADLLIGRCGAGTIFEAAHFGLPCILIPYVRGTKHQKDNAAYLKRRGCALFLDEEGASGEDLRKILLELFDNKKMRNDLSQRIKTLDNPAAANNLQEQIFALYRGRYVRK